MTFQRIHFSVIYKLPGVLWKDNGEDFHFLLQSFKFTFFLLLNWFQEISLQFYLTNSWREKWIHAFPKVFVQKRIQLTVLVFEFCSSILLSVQITITLPAHLENTYILKGFWKHIPFFFLYIHLILRLKFFL